MLKHLLTERTQGALVGKWLLENPEDIENPVYELEFTRICAGVSFEHGNFAVVVGERALIHQESLERYYVVVDEVEENITQGLIDRLIALKDRYFVEVIYASDTPQQSSDALKRTEGLSFYRNEGNPRLARSIWPTFRSFDLRAGIHTTKPPEERQLHADIEHLLATELRDPRTAAPIVGPEGRPAPKLTMPHDFPTDMTRAAIRQALVGPSQALWFACMGLERSSPWLALQNSESAWEHKPHPAGGY